jgi:hypothetical protein
MLLIGRPTVLSVMFRQCVRRDSLERERQIQVFREDEGSIQLLSHLDHLALLDSCYTMQPPIRGTIISLANISTHLR